MYFIFTHFIQIGVSSDESLQIISNVSILILQHAKDMQTLTLNIYQHVVLKRPEVEFFSYVCYVYGVGTMGNTGTFVCYTGTGSYYQ